MSKNQNTLEFSIPTSREYWEEKTYEEIKKSTYLNPLFDPGFKAFLGEEQTLKSFLNGVFHLESEHKIESVSIKNIEINIIFPTTKTFRLDIRATTADGRNIDIEMQKAKPAHFVERVLLQHSAFLLQSKYEQDKDFLDNFPENPTDKERHERDDRFYKIPQTIAIWICDFHIENQVGYRGSWAVKNEDGLPVTDKIEYIMYDLTQFSIPKDKIRTDEERWLYLLKMAGTSDNLPDFDDRVIANAIKRLLVKTASEKLLREQAKNMVMTEEELDYLASLKVRAHDEGLEQGRVEMALAMLADNEPVEKIVKYSHLSESKVLELKMSLANETHK
jgi:predicted transposase/invertase (TIGR01784 family)